MFKTFNYLLESGAAHLPQWFIPGVANAGAAGEIALIGWLYIKFFQQSDWRADT